jgi:hypothetical protein
VTTSADWIALALCFVGTVSREGCMQAKAARVPVRLAGLGTAHLQRTSLWHLAPNTPSHSC